MSRSRPQLTTAMLLHTSEGRAGIAGGVLNAARQIGSALSVAVPGLFISQDQPAQLISVLPGESVIVSIAFLIGESSLCAL